MKIVLVFLTVVLLGLQYKLWLGDSGVFQSYALKQKAIELKQNNKKLRLRNHALESNILSLKSGGEALEEQARYELGMVKQEEDFYQFVN